MTPELWAIVGVGVALAGLMLSGQRRLGVRMDRIETRLSARIDHVEAGLSARMDRDGADLIARMDRIEKQIGDLRERTAH